VPVARSSSVFLLAGTAKVLVNTQDLTAVFALPPSIFALYEFVNAFFLNEFQIVNQAQVISLHIPLFEAVHFFARVFPAFKAICEGCFLVFAAYFSTAFQGAIGAARALILFSQI
jgi:hypothetical protein